MKYVFKVMSLQTEKKVYDICLAAHAKLVEAVRSSYQQPRLAQYESTLRAA